MNSILYVRALFIGLSVFLILFLSCKGGQRNEEGSIALRVFQPKYDLTYDDLLRNGFILDEGHVLFLHKKINDSTELRFFFNEPTKKILYEYWTITWSKNATFNEIEEFIASNRSGITSSYCPQEDTVSVFYVMSYHGGLDFKCVYWPEDSIKVLRVEHKHPYYYEDYEPFVNY